MTRYDMLLVGGTFGDDPHASKLVNELFAGIVEHVTLKYKIVNGGSFGDLELLMREIEASDHQVIVWIANVSNEHEKLVNEIKQWNPKCLLVTSKRNLEDKYSFQDIIWHALNLKSNLVIELGKDGETYVGRILDPLGNEFCCSDDFSLIGSTVGRRVLELLQYRRIGSFQVGKKKKIPIEEDFLKIIRDNASTFHDCIHPRPEAVNRFFGNASFRCESGFPSFRKGHLIYVTKRNIDKRSIDRTAFVPVNHDVVNLQRWDEGDCFGIEYYGDEKPSVDTPIQLWLYMYYKNAQYMIHSHAYAVGGDFTKDIIPCGYFEEANEIIETHRDRQAVNFVVNLKGHGSIAIADNIDYLKSIQYVARSQPESHPY